MTVKRVESVLENPGKNIAVNNNALHSVTKLAFNSVYLVWAFYTQLVYKTTESQIASFAYCQLQSLEIQ